MIIFLVDTYYVLVHIFQSYFTGTGAMIASEVILKDMGELTSTKPQQNTTKHILCA